MAGRLDGKTALITGAASGIGRASVERFVAEGAHVLAADIKESGRALETRFPGAVYFQRTDVSREADIQSAIAVAKEKFGRLDCLFNNAGTGGARGPIETLDLAEFDRSIAVLLRGVFAGFKHAVPLMRAQGGGVILSTSSVAGLTAGAGPHVYSAAKAALIQLTKSTAQELGADNIRVNCICPGGIATPIFGTTLGFDDAVAQETARALRVLFKRLQPLPRAGLPEDVAAAAAFLASDDASFITGHALVVDGGLTAGQRGPEGQGVFEELLAKGEALLPKR